MGNKYFYMEGTENIQPEVTTPETPTLTPEQSEFQRMMEYQFMSEPPTSAPEPLPTEEPAVIAETPAPVAPEIDYTQFIKENFGVESLDEAKTEWQRLQELKNSPIDLKFENEESKRLHELVRTGNIKEVYSVLEKQIKIDTLTSSEVTSDIAEDIIKLGMQLEYKELTPKEIEYRFKKQFSLPKEPVQSNIEDDEEFEIRKSEWKATVEDINTNKIIEAKLMKPKLEAAKTQIKFPDIQAQVDEEYEMFKASNAAVSEKVNNVLIPAIKSLKEGDIQLNFKVADANNQMDFDVALTPTADAFEKARQDSLSFDNFINRVCYDKDGNFKAANLQRLILLNDNFDNYVQSVARQAVNAERKRLISREAPNTTGARDFNVSTDKTEFQKAMEFALS